ncbi:TonB-dependent receptor plug domain-containing protein [Phascolarctobacterium faecium]
MTQKENPRSVEVITKEDIQNTGAISVRDALRTAPLTLILSV